MIRTTICFFILLSVISCANNPHKVSAGDQHRISSVEEALGPSVTNAVAMKAGAQDFVEIEFSKGSSLLSGSAKSALYTLIEQARDNGKINKVIVLSWSDEEYPSRNLKKLPKLQKELAEKRNIAVSQFVKEMKKVEVKTYNMAVRPTTLSKLFDTADSKFKNSLLAAGLPTTADSDQFASKATHSVILIKVK